MSKFSVIIRELRPTLLLALPMIMGQVSQMLIGITDTALIGRVGTAELAASAFTHGMFGLFFIAGIGLLFPVGVLTARDHGAGDHANCSDWLRHGRAVALTAACLAVLLLLIAVNYIDYFGLPKEVVAVMRPFFILNSISLIPVLLFQSQRQYLDAMGKPWIGTIVVLSDVVLNLILNWMFIWGHWGVPALGLTGSGVATLLARTLATIFISVWLRHETIDTAKFSVAKFRELLRLGIPSASSLLFEAGAFASAMVMMGWLGATALAAHQIALTCAAFTFMFPLGLSLATSIRISRARGEAMGTHHNEQLRAIGFGSFGFGALLMLFFVLVFSFAGHYLAAAFTTDAAVIVLTTQLLIVAAIFQLFDGGQVIGSGALRGLTDVRVPTVITFVAYWLVSLPVAFVLAFKLDLGPIGVWSGLAVGLSCAAVMLIRRFYFLTR